MNDVEQPPRRIDWATYHIVEKLLKANVLRADAMAVMLELGVSFDRARELLDGVNVR